MVGGFMAGMRVSRKFFFVLVLQSSLLAIVAAAKEIFALIEESGKRVLAGDMRQRILRFKIA